MKALIIYDSAYGNTEIIARAIARAFGDEAVVQRVSEAVAAGFEGLDWLIVGSPTQGGRPTKELAGFLRRLPAGALDGVSMATFDTRFAAADQGMGLRLLMRVIGYAAPRLAKGLQAKGGKLVLPTEGFIVEGKEGPLKQGEEDRALAWGQRLHALGKSRTVGAKRPPAKTSSLTSGGS
jgi:flavodoxin